MLVETQVAAIIFTISVQGTLSIDTSPIKGEVFVDNVSWGLAPASRQVAIGPHSVRFGYVSGYTMPVARSVTVEADKESVVDGVYTIGGDWFKLEPWMIVGGAMAAAVAIVLMSGRKPKS